MRDPRVSPRPGDRIALGGNTFEVKRVRTVGGEPYVDYGVRDAGLLTLTGLPLPLGRWRTRFAEATVLHVAESPTQRAFKDALAAGGALFPEEKP